MSSDLKEHEEEHHSRERRQPERRLQKKEPTVLEKPQKCLCDSRDSGGEKGERESRGGGEGQLLRAMVKSLLVF